jgi:hypothetical protein
VPLTRLTSPKASPLSGGLTTSLLSLPPILLTMPSLLSPSPFLSSQNLPTSLSSSQTTLTPSFFLFSSRSLSLPSPLLVLLWLGTSSPTLSSPPPLDCCHVFTFFFLSPTASSLADGLPTSLLSYPPLLLTKPSLLSPSPLSP